MLLLKLYCLLGTLEVLAVGAHAIEPGVGDENSWQNAKQGEVILLDKLWSRQSQLPRVPVRISKARGPQLLFSDRPEYFHAGNGIGLQEEVKPGMVRLYIYHVPEPANSPKIISAVIENLGGKPLKLRFSRRAFPQPGKDYQRIGKTGLVDFFNSKREKTVRLIPPGGRAVIDPKMDQTLVTQNDLVHGFYEFKISQPARITVFQRDPQQSSTEVIDRLPKLRRNLAGVDTSGAGRGLFLTSNFDVANQPGFILDTTNGPTQLILADGRHDPFIKGHDSLDGGAAGSNNGNYGVLYRIRLKRTSSNGCGLAVMITKRGGFDKWCSLQAGAVQVNQGVWPGGTIPIPGDRVAYGKDGEMVLIQKFLPLSKGKTGFVEILYSPPGGSCLPTPIVFVPY